MSYPQTLVCRPWNRPIEQPEFLPMSKKEMDHLGWQELDILLVTGDAYLDHPIHGVALLGRWLVAHGYRTGIIAQPNWERIDDFLVMGRPRLFAGVTAGALDSMLAHYTAFRKKRHDDGYTPGGKAGKRPNRATLVYTSLIRQAFPKLPVGIGGIEASLRRTVHYDFWTDKLRRSILIDAKADMLMYGMGEKSILQLADILGSGKTWQEEEERKEMRGVVFAGGQNDIPLGVKVERLPSYDDMISKPSCLIEATMKVESQVHQGDLWLCQENSPREIIITPPSEFLTEKEMDFLYALPFSRKAHPNYTEKIPALEMIQFSINSHRGCGGGCSFCSLASHQGRTIRSRSEKSIMQEVLKLTQMPNWRGSISDVGGPSANMWQAHCNLPQTQHCQRQSCLFPTVCPNYNVPQKKYLALLRKVRNYPGVKHVRVASGLRYDLGFQDEEFLRAFVSEFVGGQLKVAPEHLADHVLHLMRKPSLKVFMKFLELFKETCRQAGKKQYIIPYLISAFPGCSDKDMKEIAQWLADQNWEPQQVQCFIPTPGTVATAMFYAGVDTKGNPLEVQKTDAERLRQHGFLVKRSDYSYGGNKPKFSQQKNEMQRSHKNCDRSSSNSIKKKNKKGKY